MERFLQITSPQQLAQFSGSRMPLIAPSDLLAHLPDAHWILVASSGEPVGRCSLWWSGTPPYAGHRLGLIGHYAVQDDTAARRLLQHACGQLVARGCSLAVGPIDGTTWRRYRFITERGFEPIFFLEPDNPDDWPRQFAAHGFSPLASYTSALNPDLAHNDHRAEEIGRRLAARGIRIRTVDPQRIEESLHGIYALSLVSFHHNFLYTPIEEVEFITQYRAILPYVRPELVLLAEDGDGRLVGFLFAVPDVLQTRRGETVDTVIIKTAAVLPERAHAGLGTLLVARCHAVARELGYRRAIHALMHDANKSRSISNHYAHTIRRYTLFANPLRP